MRHDAEAPPIAQSSRPAASSHALTDARLYRPGPLLAGGVLLAPPILALASAGIAIHTLGRIPTWLPLILLLWLPLLPVAWLTMISVRTSPAGIAVARPWQRWIEIRWTLVERVERHGPRIMLRSSDGHTARFYPFVLQGGARLTRELLMRMPVHVLDARLRADARDLLGEPLDARARNLIAGPVEVRPRRLWSLALLVLVLGAALGAALAAISWPLPLALGAIVLALVIVGLCGLGLPLAVRRIALTDAGVSVTDAFGRHIGDLAWDDIQLVERTPRECVLRLRGERRLRCPGPGLLSATDAEIFRAYLQSYCLDRGALVIERRWL